MDQGDWGRVLAVLLTGAFLTVLFRLSARRGRTRQVADEPAGTPYRVYTRDFDLTLPAPAALAALAADPFLRAKRWFMREPGQWRWQVDRARALADTIDRDASLSRRVHAALGKRDWAVALLIDQSGSMRGEPIAHAAAAARWFGATLARAGIPCAILGFSTVGWQGGRAREHWLWHGQPERPGRLGALLHLIYQPFDRAMTDEDWAALLHPDLLRENIDGEAVAWAAALLAVRPEPNRLLIVLSDGAPVDDATLLYNGPNYLMRHLRAVIAEVSGAGAVTLAGLGLGYRVDQLYARSRYVHAFEELPEALTALVEGVALGQA